MIRCNYKWNLRAARKAGFEISDRPMTKGPCLTAEGAWQIANVLSDLPTLAKYAEVELKGTKPGTQIFIKTPQLIRSPQVFIGYQPSGHVVLLSSDHAFDGHGAISGQSGTGKSVLLGLIVYQLVRQGYRVVYISLKARDDLPLAMMKAAADSLTRLDAHGNRIGTEFAFITLQPNVRTKGFSDLLHCEPDCPKWVQAGRLLRALGQGGSAQDPTRRYFVTSGQEFLQSIPNWGKSMRELNENITKLKLDRDKAYRTAGLRHEIAQQAAIAVANLPESHPSAVDIPRLFRHGGCLYVDACTLEVGEPAPAFAAVFLNRFRAIKSIVDPSNSIPVFIPIDESAQWPKADLKLRVEQDRGQNNRLILAYHSASQFADDWESICMARTRIICGAVPGGFTDQVLLPRMFGKEKIYRMNFGQAFGSGMTTSTTHTLAPLGSSTAIGNALSANEQSSFGFSEQDDFVFGPNETAALNADSELFVLHVAPGCDLANFGPKPIVCRRSGLLFNQSQVRLLVEQILNETHNTFVPGRQESTVSALSEVSQGTRERRQALLTILESADLRFRQNAKTL